MIEALYVPFMVWWIGYIIIASVAFVTGLFGALIIKLMDGSFSQGEARFCLSMMSAPVFALVWPVLLVVAILVSTKSLWADAEIEGPLARRARIREERRIAFETARDAAVRERDRTIRQLERELQAAGVLQ